MYLKKINVYGFKSFVDSTEVSFKGDIVGVVGPNGCGKSNVIDAVRWVMGESSAKMLRGASMDDVIFNGSSTRKAVGKASVELLFDNSLGRIKSAYAEFAEIAIRRTLSRDGQSIYLINDKKVRRKDVVDLFRGTGLGPRSYSIIEQGMVSRIVEARPEDLRAFVEEAAGISRYKDKRRETEIRIKNTRENLERVEDIRGELLKQVARLKRQAQSARRYRTLQSERRDTTGQLYALRYHELQTLEQEDIERLKEAKLNLEKTLSKQRHFEADIEAERAQHTDLQSHLNQTQGQFYQAGAEVAKLEQEIDHIKRSQKRLTQERDELTAAVNKVEAEVNTDQLRLTDTEAEILALEPAIKRAEIELTEVQATMQQASKKRNQWQDEWNQFSQSLQRPIHEKQVQQSLIDQLARQEGRSSQSHRQMTLELDTISQALTTERDQVSEANVSSKAQAVAAADSAINDYEQKLAGLRDELRNVQSDVSDQRSIQQTASARLNSLREFQQAELGDDKQEAQLQSMGLSNHLKLAQRIVVEKGWQRAADRILAPFLNAITGVDPLHAVWQSDDDDQTLTAFSDEALTPNNDSSHDWPKLADFVTSESAYLTSLLGGVFVAETLADALSMRQSLYNGDKVVTQTGTIIGRNWISHANQASLNTGFLVRAEEIQALQTQLDAAATTLAPLQARQPAIEEELRATEQELGRSRQSRRELGLELSRLDSELARQNTTRENQQLRKQVLEQELKELVALIEEEQSRKVSAQLALAQASAEAGELNEIQQELTERGDAVKSTARESETRLSSKQTAMHQLALSKARLETAVDSLRKGLERLAEQQLSLQARSAQIDESKQSTTKPLSQLNQQLQLAIETRQTVEGQLAKVRDTIASHEDALRDMQQVLSRRVQAVATAREQQEREKMGLNSVEVRQQTMVEEIAKEGYKLKRLMKKADFSTPLHECEAQLEKLNRKIGNIGPVNLVAIEEYETESERANYLEQQHADLTKALETLEAVINKMDKETKKRFRQTFKALNKGFSNFFPKLFGGGRASLELTTDDWLTTGIAVTAQPPGKRNSTIYLLSGGEKALTAVALLFGLFELNPAPFCMLDEVDAPLDDANVDRFCQTLNTLSEYSQMIVITHNKITMQAAQSLIGVTMNEPGVSRVVSVSVDDAMKMVD